MRCRSYYARAAPRSQLVSATNRLADSARDCRRPGGAVPACPLRPLAAQPLRREALLALNHPHTVDSWMQLIKRVQLVHQPRQTVSQTLAPEAVLVSLTLDADLRNQLIARYCRADNALNDQQTARLRAQLAQWLKELPHV